MTPQLCTQKGPELPDTAEAAEEQMQPWGAPFVPVELARTLGQPAQTAEGPRVQEDSSWGHRGHVEAGGSSVGLDLSAESSLSFPAHRNSGGQSNQEPRRAGDRTES